MNSQTDFVEVLPSVKNNQYYWRRKSRNGEIISSSELYTSKSNARRGAKRANPDLQPTQFKNVDWELSVESKNP